MTLRRAYQLLERSFAARPGVEDLDEIVSVERDLGRPLPADYKWFLMRSNGGETVGPLRRFRFYPLEELLPRRQDGQPPKVLEFATDDSDGWAFDLSANRDTAKYQIVRYPLGDTTRAEVETASKSFADLLQEIADT